FAGLAAMTAIIAFAMGIAAPLAWPLIAIAMLPAAAAARSVFGGGGGAVACATVVAALCRRAVMSRLRLPAQTACWMALNALTKPTNVALVLLGLISPARQTGWARHALMILPAVALALLWTWRSGADTATWRMVEITGLELSAFDPLAKLLALLDQPLRFPAAVFGTFSVEHFAGLWRQLIGVLGLFDTVLQDWVYPAVSVLLLGTFFTQLPLTPAERARIAVVTAMTLCAYTLAVYLVCYLVFTPADADIIWGVQGRYFVPVLPAVAIMLSAVVHYGPDERLRAALAIACAVLSGGASIQAILETDWHI